jgi:hypothetical protein
VALCACGCGQETRLAPRTDRKSGWVKGEPLRYIRNHHRRRSVAPAEVAKGGIEVPLVGTHGAGKVAIVDPEDYPKVASYRWHLSPGGYVVYSPNSQTKIYMHRLIEPEGEEVDHVNGDKLDCRRVNLRPCTHRENTRNRSRQAAKRSSRYVGVYGRCKATQRWHAAIDGRHLGSFESEEEAALTYDKAAFAKYDEFAPLNFPDRLTPEGR